jgi:predicted secreted protein
MPDLELTRDEDGQQFKVRKGDTIVIRLPENQTTGFQWAVQDEGDPALTYEGSDYSEPAKAGLGAGVQRTMMFKAKSAGTGHVHLKLWREWAGEESVAERFRATVQVANAPTRTATRSARKPKK